jgi:RNA polymerase sigma factor (sigma-70 family)
MDALREFAFADRRIRNSTRRLVGMAGITDEDLKDLRQDIWVDLIRRLPRYRPDRGTRQAFIARVIRNRIASILKSRTAAKRGGGKPALSLNWESFDESGDPVELHESLSADHYLRLTRGVRRSEEERRDLALDVRKVVERLPPHHRVLCLLLIDHDVCNIANVVGIPRSTLRDLIKRLRSLCHDAGLADYCD